MKTRLALLLTAAFIATSFFAPVVAGASSAPTFAGVPWGSSDATVKRIMAAKGFAFVKRDSDGDLDFKGSIEGQSVEIFELMTPARALAKAMIVFLTPDDEAIQYFHDMESTLIAKYGSPEKQFAFYQYPYTDSDPEAEHETAFQVGKATLASFWKFADEGGLYVEVTKHLTVNLSYESAAWANEAKRRQGQENSVF